MTSGVISEKQVEPCQAPDEMAVSEVLRNPKLYNRLVNLMSTRNLSLSGQSGHDQFFDAFNKFAGGSKGKQIAELTNRAGHQNIKYMEIMLSLGSSVTKDYGQKIGFDGDINSTYGKLITAGIQDHVQEGIKELDRHENEIESLQGCGSVAPQPGCRVTRRYLLQISRVLDPALVFSQFVYAFELAQRDARVVGVNMVTPEDNVIALRDYDLHMNMLAYLAKKYPEVPLSLHAGELTLGLVPPRYLQDHIQKAVEIAGAKRIGHGVDVFYEDRPQALLTMMKQRDVIVEICLTSNDIILGVKGKDHPFPDYLHSGVPVTLATDDEGISRIDLTNEYLRAATTYGLGYPELKQLARNSLSYSFLSGTNLWTSKQALRVADACRNDSLGSNDPSPACQALLKTSDKARLQWQLEKDFQIFEQSQWLQDSP